jgi:tRNA G18 (ribose-2'-O)-methylase SpoU
VDVVYGTQPVLAALEARRRTVHRLYLKDESEQRTVDEKCGAMQASSGLTLPN